MKWYQIYVKHESADVVQMMKRSDPILQTFGSAPVAPNGVPIRMEGDIVEVRSFGEISFSMTKSYLKGQGFIIESVQENN